MTGPHKAKARNFTHNFYTLCPASLPKIEHYFFSWPQRWLMPNGASAGRYSWRLFLDLNLARLFNNNFGNIFVNLNQASHTNLLIPIFDFRVAKLGPNISPIKIVKI
jgi:hypothetical protein